MDIITTLFLIFGAFTSGKTAYLTREDKYKAAGGLIVCIMMLASIYCIWF